MFKLILYRTLPPGFFMANRKKMSIPAQKSDFFLSQIRFDNSSIFFVANRFDIVKEKINVTAQIS